MMHFLRSQWIIQMKSVGRRFRVGDRLLTFCQVLMVALCVWTAGANAQASQGKPATGAPPEQSPKVQMLLELLEDKDVQQWAKQQRQPATKPREIETKTSSTVLIATRLQAISDHVFNIFSTLPRLPEEIRLLFENTRTKTQGYSFPFIFMTAFIFMSGGYLLAFIFDKATTRFRSKLDQAVVSGPKDRFRLMASELALVAGSIVAFKVGSIVVFLMFNLPDLAENIILQFLFAALASWTAWRIFRFLLKPSSHNAAGVLSEQRVIPLDDENARHFTGMLVLAVTWFSFGYAFVGTLRQLGMDFTASQLVAYILGLGLVAIGIYTVVKQPSGPHLKSRLEDGTVDSGPFNSWQHVAGFVVLWLFWALTAMHLFWVLAMVLFLPIAIRSTRSAVHKFFQYSVVVENEGVEEQTTGYSVWAAVVERGLRAVLILGAVLVVVSGWGSVLGVLESDHTLTSRIISGAVKLLIVYLIGDLLWQIVKTAIDTTLDSMPELGEHGRKETVQQAKLRTILPIIRNGAMILLITLVIMMGLSALGVEIGPLIASAGIVGVAVGFGSQALVKDVISGMFYLFDDAFRIGEYIQAGSFKGTVESFSLRSVRLRHHRGPIYTIPFGDLGAVQNLSRDYVIDKLTFQVTYETDLELARKLIKKAGQELAENPEIGPNIISPLKMQRVNNFGEYGIEIMTKMTCVPGGQWEIRPKIYPLVKRLFEENGIEFARPTVKVSGSPADKNAAAGSVAAKRSRQQSKQ